MKKRLWRSEKNATPRRLTSGRRISNWQARVQVVSELLTTRDNSKSPGLGRVRTLGIGTTIAFANGERPLSPEWHAGEESTFSEFFPKSARLPPLGVGHWRQRGGVGEVLPRCDGAKTSAGPGALPCLQVLRGYMRPGPRRKRLKPAGSSLACASFEHVDYHPRRPFSTAGGLDPARC
jgi:hypothetical protein